MSAVIARRPCQARKQHLASTRNERDITPKTEINLRRHMVLDTFRPNEKPYGVTYGHWTVKWWQWLYAFGRDSNPAIDETGKHSAIDQYDPNVWFLAGTFARAKIPNRICNIPQGRSILFPTINYQANFLHDPVFHGERELYGHVSSDVDDIVYNQCVVDGVDLVVYRVSSDPLLFPLNIAEGIPYTVNGGDDLIQTVQRAQTQV